ncbi:MAG: hypothetical protein MUF34_27380 [Polyangiaceae bacterium]|nr:hypothetical protein [Polyangiaceae bacterium]
MALDPHAVASAELEGPAENGSAEGANDAASIVPALLDEGGQSLEAEGQLPHVLERVLERVAMPASAPTTASALATPTTSTAAAAPTTSTAAATPTTSTAAATPTTSTAAATPTTSTAAAAPTASAAPTLGIARVVALRGRSASVVWRSGARPVTARLADEVESELIARVVEEKGLVLVEQGGELTVVGVIQTREGVSKQAAPAEVALRGRAVRLESEGALSIKAETIEIEGGSEILLRVGPVALRLRRDGNIELVGSSVYLTSRGVFRLIGRVLRLN